MNLTVIEFLPSLPFGYLSFYVNENSYGSLSPDCDLSHNALSLYRRLRLTFIMRRNEKSRVVIQLRFDELVPNFSHLSPRKKSSFPLSDNQQQDDMCSNPTKSGNSTSEDSTFKEIFEKNRSKSEQMINDSVRPTARQRDP